MKVFAVFSVEQLALTFARGKQLKFDLFIGIVDRPNTINNAENPEQGGMNGLLDYLVKALTIGFG